MVYSSNGTIEIEGDGLDILTETAALMSAVYRSMCEELGEEEAKGFLKLVFEMAAMDEVDGARFIMGGEKDN